MGIYIAGMKMPKDRRKHNALLQFLEDGKCRAIVDYSKAYDDRDVKVFEVVPIPTGHGRLIDADALLQSLKESIDECHKWADEVEGGEMYARVSQALGTFVECSLRVKAAPSIIPASGEGE